MVGEACEKESPEDNRTGKKGVDKKKGQDSDRIEEKELGERIESFREGTGIRGKAKMQHSEGERKAAANWAMGEVSNQGDFVRSKTKKRVAHAWDQCPGLRRVSRVSLR